MANVLMAGMRAASRDHGSGWTAVPAVQPCQARRQSCKQRLGQQAVVCVRTQIPGTRVVPDRRLFGVLAQSGPRRIREQVVNDHNRVAGKCLLKAGGLGGD